MTILARILSFFPLTVFLLIIYSFKRIIHEPTIQNFSFLLLSYYIYPLLIFRLHNLFFPLKEGAFNLAEKKHSPWWGSYKIQEIYYHLPWPEALLQLIPGLFSLWLRLWGSKIGKKVLWTPSIEINDRSLMQVGNHVVFGHRSHFLGHVIRPKNEEVLLIVSKIKIGSNAFIGAGSRFGPGVIIEEGSILPAMTIGLPRQNFKKENDSGRSKEL